VERDVRLSGTVTFVLVGLALAACSTPSARYGLAPPEKGGSYPNINLDPTKKSAEPVMTPEQRDAAEAELQRQAGKRPKAQAPAAN
jgi:hypothetical protein